MFWRFGLNSSAVDNLLDKEDLTLEELLDEDELLQECKAHNSKLIEYLRKPSILSQLLNYVIRDDLDDKQKFKYPFVACEVLSCEIWAICEAVVENIELLTSFWQFLDRPAPLNQTQANYFLKVNTVFLQKKTSELVKFIQSIPNIVRKMLTHVETSAVLDLLLKLISLEEYPEGAGVTDWLNSEGLIEALVSKLDPNLDPEIHSVAAAALNDIIIISQSSNPEQGGVGPNALSRELISERVVSRLVDYMLDPQAPNSTSTLTNGVSIFIQIIQKNHSDYGDESMISLAPQQQLPVVDLSDMLQVLANRIGEFKALLEKPKSVMGEIDTTIGRMVPLGFERFRICELFAELLHCSNMSLLNVRHEANGYFDARHMEDYTDYGQGDASFASNSGQNEGVTGDIAQPEQSATSLNERPDESSQTTANLAPAAPISEEVNKPGTEPSPAHSSSPMEIVESEEAHASERSAVQSPSHSSAELPMPVGDLLKAKFIEHKIMPTCLDLFFHFKWNNFLHTVVYDMIAQIFNGRMDIGNNKDLAISVFTDGQLTKRITKAQRLNDYEVEQRKGVRLGYMGHLTFIAEEFVKLLDRYPVEIGEKVTEYIEAEDWQEYVSRTLRETRERDRQALGGQRPSNHDSRSPSREGSEDDDDDDEPIESVADGDMANDQFARYLCQQITSELSDKVVGSSDSEEDDDDSWMAEEFDRESDSDIRGPFVNTPMLDSSFPNRQSYSDEEEPQNSDSAWHAHLDDGKQAIIADYSNNFESAFTTTDEPPSASTEASASNVNESSIIHIEPPSPTTGVAGDTTDTPPPSTEPRELEPSISPSRTSAECEEVISPMNISATTTMAEVTTVGITTETNAIADSVNTDSRTMDFGLTPIDATVEMRDEKANEASTDGNSQDQPDHREAVVDAHFYNQYNH